MAELHGYLALLYYFGVADAHGEFGFPTGTGNAEGSIAHFSPHFVPALLSDRRYIRHTRISIYIYIVEVCAQVANLS